MAVKSGWFLGTRRLAVAEFAKISSISASARTVFAWHQTPDALQRLIPPWEPVVIEKAPASLRDGETAVLVMRLGPLKLRWVARHSGFVDRGEEGGEFVDEQISGPFASWVHRHIVRADGPGRCILEDRIQYSLPLGAIGRLFASGLVRRKLVRMFDYRHQVTRAAVVQPRGD